jgi:hypothetical protein
MEGNPPLPAGGQLLLFLLVVEQLYQEIRRQPVLPVCFEKFKVQSSRFIVKSTG